MASFKALCLAGVVGLAATATAAHAADLLPPPPPVEVPYIPAPAIGGGWYLRGDVGASASQLTDYQSSFVTQPANFAHNGHSLEESALVGLGVGYQINNYFRADVTGEYRFDSKYHAIETATGCNGVGLPCADQYGGKIGSGVVLVNGYFDLGTWYHITPYIGAGVGVAFNSFSGLTDYNLNFQNGYPSGYAQSQTTTSLAYAGMAGITYDLSQNLKLDFGYRYLNMGKVASAPIVCSAGCTYERQSYKLYSHDIRIGLRYAFADAVPYAPRFPIVSKY